MVVTNVKTIYLSTVRYDYLPNLRNQVSGFGQAPQATQRAAAAAGAGAGGGGGGGGGGWFGGQGHRLN